MESLNEHGVYRIQRGRVLDQDDEPVKNIISIGLQNLTDTPSSPLTEYNSHFVRLQRRRRKQPLTALSTSPTPSAAPDDHPPSPFNPKIPGAGPTASSANDVVESEG
ncbi:hypothetical protein H0H92_010314, partial [Tricholoma furcatifolium]